MGQSPNLEANGQSTIGPVEAGVAEELALLRHLMQAEGLPFDPTQAARALRQAEADIPPTEARAARRRLALAAEDLGLQFMVRHLSAREAIATVEIDAPLAIFAVSGGTAHWHLLAESRRGLGRMARLTAGETDVLLTPDELARRIGAADADAVVEWLVPQPAEPLADASVHHQDSHDHHDHHQHGPSPLARLFGLLRPERWDLIVVVVYSIAIGVLSLAVPITAMAVVNTTAMATLVQQLVVLCLALLVSLGLAAFLRGLQAVVVEYLQRRLFVRVVADLAYRLPRVDRRAYDEHHGPELVNRFFSVLTVQKAAATLLLDGVAVVLQMGVGLLLLAVYHQLLLGLDILLVASLAVIVFVLGRGAIRTSIRESRAKYAVASWMEELARHPAAFKLHGGPAFAMERADQLARHYLLARADHFAIVLRQFGAALAVQALASTALLGIGGYLVIQGQLTLGQLVAAEIILTLVVASFSKLHKQLESYYELLAAVDKLGHLTDLPLERDTGVAHRARSEGATVRVTHLCFSYGEGRTVLHDFDLTVEAGERVALVGPNGSGKSTLIDLLFGMREPTAGCIEIDGVDLRDLRLESLRRHVAVVKGVEIFESSVLDNVRMGREELSLAAVRAALAAVRLLDEVQDLPNGLNTRLGTGGAPLSLGQAERLMIARAIAGQPRFLVLDETLDAMSPDIRQEVLPALMGQNARWSLLVITHDREVAKLCDREVLLERPGLITAKRGGH